jgi:hypothetical protein
MSQITKESLCLAFPCVLLVTANEEVLDTEARWLHARFRTIEALQDALKKNDDRLHGANAIHSKLREEPMFKQLDSGYVTCNIHASSASRLAGEGLWAQFVRKINYEHHVLLAESEGRRTFLRRDAIHKLRPSDDHSELDYLWNKHSNDRTVIEYAVHVFLEKNYSRAEHDEVCKHVGNWTSAAPTPAFQIPDNAFGMRPLQFVPQDDDDELQRAIALSIATAHEQRVRAATTTTTTTASNRRDVFAESNVTDGIFAVMALLEQQAAVFQSVSNAVGELRTKVDNIEVALGKMHSRMEQSERSHWFISHSGEDKRVALALAAALRSDSGRDVWFDRVDIRSDDCVSAITDGVRRAIMLILVLTPAAHESRWVQREVGMAMALGIDVFAFRPGELVSNAIAGNSPTGTLQERYCEFARKLNVPPLSVLDALLARIAEPVTETSINALLLNAKTPTSVATAGPGHAREDNC